LRERKLKKEKTKAAKKKQNEYSLLIKYFKVVRRCVINFVVNKDCELDMLNDKRDLDLPTTDKKITESLHIISDVQQYLELLAKEMKNYIEKTKEEMN